MNQQQEVRGLFFIEALTPMHPGLGKGGEGFVDLPVQRDEFGFPTIWASSLKGAVKSSLLLECDNSSNEIERLVCRRRILLTFGPDTGEASEYASAISMLDARLILIPARSLKGVWTYVTSPHLLNYLFTYLEAINDNNRLGILRNLLNNVSSITKKTAVVNTNGLLIESSGKRYIVLNELELTAEPNGDTAKQLTSILPNELTSIINERGIALVSDDVISDVVRRSLIIQPRIRLDYASKTVAGGGLWEEEYLPQYTIMTSAIFCKRVRLTNLPEDELGKRIEQFIDKDLKNTQVNRNDLSKKYEDLISNELSDANKVCNIVAKLNYMMFGGKETIGKGLAKLIWVR
ncbi:MAG: type III-B CRISPR module RAMP protein Cmr4 [Caldivirga sp.]|uniref:type III-B CRISPR module RAMP protein Cmr4 n=2 Tax=Caldivirga sp. TaxID=2080243 RepID=UPI003D144757